MNVDLTRLLVDAGQTGVKLRVEDEGARDHVLRPVDTSQAVAPQLVEAVAGFLSAQGVRPKKIGLCSTGVSDVEEAARIVRAGLSGWGVEEVHFAHDSVGGFFSALGYSQGVVTMVGTGIVTLGVGPSGAARVDGWGNIIGDAGSGYWIGRMGMEAALRAYDHRSKPTSLLDAFHDEFPDVENAYLEIQSLPDRVYQVAKFAKTVVEFAEHDETAMSIVQRACEEISLSIKTALASSGFSVGEAATVSATGGLLRNPLFHESLKEATKEAWPTALIVDPKGEPLDGVGIMMTIESTHPLAPRVSIAR
jgi:N-acetylglucosamine kinase-like BadF-type ATPase